LRIDMTPPFTLTESDLQTTATGLQYQIVELGSGPVPTKGQTVQAHYHGTLADGKVFDSSYKRGAPFEFQVGRGQVIAGWDEAFGMFAVGTKAILVLPYQLAYGEGGYPGSIPPKATLRFDVELVGVK
jgi:FKBP-type peptidyl-prolyl cis-trans isomerase